MAAACELAEDLQDNSTEGTTLTETEIVAQAITELHQVCAPGTTAGDNTTLVTVGETGTYSAPFINFYGTGETETETNTEQTPELLDGADDSEATQVIYYIEDGVVARSEKVLVDTSVQANDYEIERRSGRLPARRRVIPFKFRDYKNTSNDEDSDSDYEPEVKPKVKRVQKDNTDNTPTTGTQKPPVTAHKRPGRPRKNPLPPYYHEVSRVVVTSNEGQTLIDAEGQAQNETRGQGQDKGHIQKEAEGEKVSDDITVKQEVEVTAENVDEQTDENQGEEDVVFICPPRKGRGRPRGPNWRKDYKCPTCGKVFAQKGNLKTHLRTHTDERPFICLEANCGKQFRSAESLRRHILSHRGIKPFECDICQNKFSSNISLQEHRSRHTELKPHKCPHCTKYFRQISCLRRHVLTHSSDKPFLCSVCKQRFSQMPYLKSHMKVHTGEKPFQCDICQKRFAHQSDVKRHKITHTVKALVMSLHRYTACLSRSWYCVRQGEKRYSCEMCQAKFSDPSSKRRHEKEHSKRKSYICQLCDETFKRAGQLKAHLTRKHMLAIQVETEKGYGNSSLLVDLHNEQTGFTDSVPANQRIVQLIKSLSTKTSLSSVESIESDAQSINSCIVPKSIASVDQSQQVTVVSDHVTEMNQLQTAGAASLMESSSEVPIQLQGIEVQEEVEGGQTYIAITDLAESLLTNKDSSGDGDAVYQYQIIQEIRENGDTHQVLVPYGETANVDSSQIIQETVQDNIIDLNETAEETKLNIAKQELATTVEISEVIADVQVSDSGEMETVEAVAAVEAQEASVDKDIAGEIVMYDYVTSPDFSSQGYYNWLSNFTELCKVLPMPLDTALFQKISQVHKTLSDVMATPSGVVADKENFRVLMNISKELSTIINEHLVFVLENLNPDGKTKDSL